MSAQSLVPKDHPLMVAWEAYQATEAYANTRSWALKDAHVDGSLWAAFERGWDTAHAHGYAAGVEAFRKACAEYFGDGIDGSLYPHELDRIEGRLTSAHVAPEEPDAAGLYHGRLDTGPTVARAARSDRYVPPAAPTGEAPASPYDRVLPSGLDTIGGPPASPAGETGACTCTDPTACPRLSYCANRGFLGKRGWKAPTGSDGNG